MNDKIRDLIMAIPDKDIDEVEVKIVGMLHGAPSHKSPLQINRGNVMATYTPQSKRCPICNQDIKDNYVPVWNNIEASYVHTWCINIASKNGWDEGHHNTIRESSHRKWLVFWRGECAEVATHKEAKELLKQLNEGDSTKSGGTD